MYAFLFKKSIQIPIYFVLVCLFLSLLYLLSAFTSDFNSNDEIVFYGFGYKYIFLILIFLSFFNLNVKTTDLYRSVLFTWIFLSAWAFYYAFFIIGNPLSAILFPNQVSFPGTGTSENITPDSHLYAYTVGFLGLFLFMLSESKFKFSFLFLTLIVVALTGSRNPFALYIILFLFFLLRESNLKSLFFISLLLVGTIVLIQTTSIVDLLPSTRSFTFILGEDASSMSRINKFLIALSEYSKGYIILGQSVFGSKINWADGIHTQLLIHFGPLGLGFYIFWLLNFLFGLSKKTKDRDSRALFYLSSYLFIGLFITEFILVSRGAVLTLVPLIILFFNSRKGNENSRLSERFQAISS